MICIPVVDTVGKTPFRILMHHMQLTKWMGWRYFTIEWIQGGRFRGLLNADKLILQFQKTEKCAQNY